MTVGTDIKLSFIHRCVRQYTEEVIKAMDRTIAKNNVIATGALKHSLSQAADENTGKLIFLEYGRFVDMGVGRGKRLADVAAEKPSLNKLQRRARKRKQIYSKIAYGKLNGLMGDLMYGLTEETIAEIKKELLAHE